MAFIENLWTMVEPSQPFVKGWAIEAMCDHLEAVANGDIRNLYVNVPPGFLKSLGTSVFLPAWIWGPLKNPTKRFLSVSYSSTLSQRDNGRFRNLITSDLYNKLWGDVFQPAKDKFSVIEVHNNKSGWKTATSTTGTVTGLRADVVLCDDPNSVTDAESKLVLESTKNFFLETLQTRLNDPKKSSIIVIQQRCSDLDITGTIVEKGLDYEGLVIPLEFEPKRFYKSSIGWSDPRGMVNGDPYGDPLPLDDLYAQDGVIAFPERFPQKVVDDLKKNLGPYAYASQMQQSPEPRGGGIFKEDWWQIWPPDDHPVPANGTLPSYPPFDYVLASLDTAYTDSEENDPSALTVWAVWKPTGTTSTVPQVVVENGQLTRLTEDTRSKIMLIYGWEKHLVLRGKPDVPPPGVTDEEWKSPAYRDIRRKSWGLVEWVIQTCRDMKVDHLIIEAKANGMPAAQEMERSFQYEEFSVELVDPSRQGDKVARAHSVVSLFSNGRVYAPYIYIHKEDRWDFPSWCRMVLDRMRVFPKGAHDDIVDSATAALRYLRGLGMAPLSDEQEVDYQEENAYKRPSKPLYDV